MKQTIKTGVAALLLLLAISCKKENSNIQSSAINSNSSVQAVTTDNIVLASNTVRIGTQKWMAKNLDIGRYRNGDKIPQVKSAAVWASLTTGAWCWYNNDSATGAVYGKLYNWYAVNDPRGLAPVGWHIPSDAEWATLTSFLGGYGVAGGKLKETGTVHWAAPNTGATNSSGFIGLPGGAREHTDGTFNNYIVVGYWWSSTYFDSFNAWYHDMYYAGAEVYRFSISKRHGLSVRCLKD